MSILELRGMWREDREHGVILTHRKQTFFLLIIGSSRRRTHGDATAYFQIYVISYRSCQSQIKTDISQSEKGTV